MVLGSVGLNLHVGNDGSFAGSFSDLDGSDFAGVRSMELNLGGVFGFTGSDVLEGGFHLGGQSRSVGLGPFDVSLSHLDSSGGGGFLMSLSSVSGFLSVVLFFGSSSAGVVGMGLLFVSSGFGGMGRFLVLHCSVGGNLGLTFMVNSGFVFSVGSLSFGISLLSGFNGSVVVGNGSFSCGSSSFVSRYGSNSNLNGMVMGGNSGDSGLSGMGPSLHGGVSGGSSSSVGFASFNPVFEGCLSFHVHGGGVGFGGFMFGVHGSGE